MTRLRLRLAVRCGVAALAMLYALATLASDDPEGYLWTYALRSGQKSQVERYAELHPASAYAPLARLAVLNPSLDQASVNCNRKEREFRVGARAQAEIARQVAEYERRAEAGDTLAMTDVGLILVRGWFDCSDPTAAGERALVVTRRAAERGSARGMYNLQGMLNDAVGRGGDADAALAIEYLRRAAAAGYANAQLELATLKLDGARGVAIDRDTGRRELEALAQHGFALAAMELALRLDSGKGVELNRAAAWRWVELAAHHGLPRAMHLLGRRWDQQSRQADTANATPLVEASVNWLTRSASLGNHDSMFELFKVHRDGALAAPDPVAAVGWLRRAEEAGSVAARDAMVRSDVPSAGIGGLGKKLQASSLSITGALLERESVEAFLVRSRATDVALNETCGRKWSMYGETAVAFVVIDGPKEALLQPTNFQQCHSLRGETRALTFEPAHGLRPGRYLVAATQTDFTAGHAGTWRLLAVWRGEAQTAEEFDRGRERLRGIVR